MLYNYSKQHTISVKMIFMIPRVKSYNLQKKMQKMCDINDFNCGIYIGTKWSGLSLIFL